MLAPAIKARGNRRKRLTGKKLREFSDKDYERARTVEDLIDQVIRTRYLSSNRPTVASSYENLQARIVDDNKLRSDNDQLPIPDISSLYRRVKTFDPYEVDSTRHGRNTQTQNIALTSWGHAPRIR